MPKCLLIAESELMRLMRLTKEMGYRKGYTCDTTYKGESLEDRDLATNDWIWHLETLWSFVHDMFGIYQLLGLY